MARDQPHYGCPKCGSPKFTATQNITSYGTEVVYCTYTSTTPDELPDFTIDDWGDRDLNDSESGGMEDTKSCDDCGHEYTEPRFYGPHNTLEEVAERSGIPVQDVEPFTRIIDTFAAAESITVAQEPHATVILVEPHEIQRGNGLKQWSVFACPHCNEEMESKPRVRQVYRDGMKLLDRRQVPVLVRAPLCLSCDSFRFEERR